MKSIASDILNNVFKTKNICKKDLEDSIPMMQVIKPRLLPFVKKGILKSKLLKASLTHTDVLVILRHLAKTKDKYILYKRKSIRKGDKWITGYEYRLTD